MTVKNTNHNIQKHGDKKKIGKDMMTVEAPTYKHGTTSASTLSTTIKKRRSDQTKDANASKDDDDINNEERTHQKEGNRASVQTRNKEEAENNTKKVADTSKQGQGKRGKDKGTHDAKGDDEDDKSEAARGHNEQKTPTRSRLTEKEHASEASGREDTRRREGKQKQTRTTADLTTRRTAMETRSHVQQKISIAMYRKSTQSTRCTGYWIKRSKNKGTETNGNDSTEPSGKHTKGVEEPWLNTDGKTRKKGGYGHSANQQESKEASASTRKEYRRRRPNEGRRVNNTSRTATSKPEILKKMNQCGENAGHTTKMGRQRNYIMKKKNQEREARPLEENRTVNGKTTRTRGDTIKNWLEWVWTDTTEIQVTRNDTIGWEVNKEPRDMGKNNKQHQQEQDREKKSTREEGRIRKSGTGKNNDEKRKLDQERKQITEERTHGRKNTRKTQTVTKKNTGQMISNRSTMRARKHKTG